MNPYNFDSFASATRALSSQLLYRSKLVHSARWQGADIASRPEMATHEITHVSFSVPLPSEDPGHYADDINPNMPWAESHFLERVCGAPINPGIEWENWPYSKSAANFLDDRGMFNHNYMERYWPKHAGYFTRPTATAQEWEEKARIKRGIEDPRLSAPLPINRGIQYDYGDLNDVVSLLASDPYTRQAYLPVWFPEDTGGGSKRAPCTIGYHFLMRDGKLDINYHIRSCDFVRHFRDDCYLTVRLLLWVLERCREQDGRWTDVTCGRFIMQIGSLHVFRNDYQIMKATKS